MTTVKSTVVQETSTSFAWSANWAVSSYSGYLGGTAKSSKTKGAASSFRFTGTGVSWVGPVGPTRGGAWVYVDGRFVKSVSAYASTFVARKTLFSMNWSTAATHTLKVVVAATAGHPTVAIDYMVVRTLVTTTLTPSGPLTITTSGTVIDGLSITTTGSSASAIFVHGTAASPVKNVTIRNCLIKGYNIGIEARHVQNLTIDHCTITDANYAGIAIYSGVGGKITYNHIQRVGYARTNLSGMYQNNAYGITLDHYAFSNLTADPLSSDFLVDHNVVEDVPLWHGLDTHAGVRITFSYNVVRRTACPIFITGDGTQTRHPRAVTVTRNRIEDLATKPGSAKPIAITLVNLQGGAVTYNAISRTYPTGVFDYKGLDPAGSINVLISGNYWIT